MSLIAIASDAGISRKQGLLGAKALRGLRQSPDLAKEVAAQLVCGQVLLDGVPATGGTLDCGTAHVIAPISCR